MVAVNRSQIEPLHHEVLNGWREVIAGSRQLGLADRIVVAIQLEKRAKALANLERLAGTADLVTETELFGAGAKQQSPINSAGVVFGAASAVLGFLGSSFIAAIQELAGPTVGAVQAGAGTTVTAVTGFLAVASGGVVFALFRGATIALQTAGAALENFGNKQHPSASLLATIRPAEDRLFGLFGTQVPNAPISAGPLFLVGAACVGVGVVFAFLVGVGVGAG